MLQIVGSVNDGDQPVPPTDTEPEITFQDWYLIYWRHVARMRAERAWAKIPKSDYVEVMVYTAAHRRAWMARIAREPDALDFACHPATFLNEKRWLDDLPTGFTLMPKTNVVPLKVNGEEKPFVKSAMPEHVKALLAELKAKHRG